MTVAAAASTCRCCREPLQPNAAFCVRCGLPTADACPRCHADVGLAAGDCGSCGAPLVHCETCGRNYSVDRTQCASQDWNCEGAPLVSAHAAFAGLYGRLSRTASVRGGPARPQPLDPPLWTFEDPSQPVLDVVAAYGRAYLVTSHSVLAIRLHVPGEAPPGGAPDLLPGASALTALDPKVHRSEPLTALDPRVHRSEPLAARGREFRRILDVAVGFGQLCVIAERHDRRPEAFVFRADDVAAWWRLESEDPARAIVPVPQGVLLFTQGEEARVLRYAMGSTVPDVSRPLEAVPRLDAPPAVHDDGAFVVFGTSSGDVVRAHVPSLEVATLLKAPTEGASGPPVLGPRHVHVLSREAGAAVTLLHQIEIDSGAEDAVSLPLQSDLRLRGGGSTRLVYDSTQRAYRAVRVDPWPGRVQAEAMPRPANEDIVTDLALDGPSLDLLVETREGGRGQIRLLRFDGEAVLRGALAIGSRFAACDDRLLLWSEGRLECCALS